MLRPTVGRDAWEPVVLPVVLGLLIGACVAYAMAAWMQHWAEAVAGAPDGLAEAEQVAGDEWRRQYAGHRSHDGASGAAD